MHSSLDFDRFQSAWLPGSDDSAQDTSRSVYQTLIDAYNEPQRYYHTLDHIAHCLSEFDQIRDQLQNPQLCELAIWFHDYIFQPGARDNELRSAQQFQQMTESVLDQPARDSGYRLIMATLHDGTGIEDPDTRFLVDIDLSSFGLPWSEFMRDNVNLRQEMAHVSDEVYQRNHSAFQHQLLDRPRIFYTDHFYQAYEQRARRNIREFMQMSARNSEAGS